ncbi:MAG TPA: phosphatidate cytidylyltransferase [Vicinamibacterales bacterium]|nr:phosphatidate cytidylyltransferase [Vicinamibacterales bacterium]HPW20136.1 phosphatidate cytidylyltransferase [Vicinamibacterales bacterium]
MTRFVSGLVMIAAFAGVLWYAPPWLFLVVIEILVVAAVLEYAGLMERTGVPVPRPLAAAAAVVICAGIAWPGPYAVPGLAAAVVVVLLAALTASEPDPRVPAAVAAALFPSLYIAVPLALAAVVRTDHGREALLLCVLVVLASDTAQYYTGTLFGRHRLAPSVSPKKSVEGAAGGFVAGVAIAAGLGRLWLPAVPVPRLVAIGIVLVGLGIAGDLFESLLKRSANVKDSSALIPGHGGVLDRIDAYLFVIPGYYLVLRLAA